MNNEAFRALVNNQRQTTKEIARAAVEDEFQKKRSRRGGGGGRRGGRGGFDQGYGSDSSDSSDEDVKGRGRDAAAQNKQQQEGDDNEPEWKRRRKEKRSQDGSSSEYRDRAKERREGNNIDYASLQGLASSNNQHGGGGEEEDRRRQAELSKYLGGDEEHTHLVKGLDKALAEKVRREDMDQQGGGGGGSGDLDQLLEDAYTQKQQQSKCKSAKDWQTLKPKTELGKSVKDYLLQKQKSEQLPTPIVTSQIKTNPTIQKSIQRSILSFSTKSDVRDRKNAWEAPRISVQSFGMNQQVCNSIDRKMTPLNRHMIDLVSKKLDGGSSSRGKEKSTYGTHSQNELSEKEQIVEGNEGSSSQTKSEANSNNKDARANGAGATKKLAKEESDSDDDIFADAGTYVPGALTSNPAESVEVDTSTTEIKDDKESSKQTKQSIFDNLIPETAQETSKPIHTQQQQPKLQLQQTEQHHNQTENKNVIDRDIFGGQKTTAEALPYHKRRGPQVAAREGYGMANYEGGYGEEMDVDFGNFDEDRRKQDKDDEDGDDGEDNREDNEED